MRSAEQISRTAGEWHDAQRQERENHLRALLGMLRSARESGAEWYRWIVDGQPPLTREQYAAIGGKHAKATKR